MKKNTTEIANKKENVNIFLVVLVSILISGYFYEAGIAVGKMVFRLMH